MAMSKTVMGKRFKYRGSLTKGIYIDFHDPGADWLIPVEIIEVIKKEIAERSPVRMGASRRPLVKDSVGETLFKEQRVLPRRDDVHPAAARRGRLLHHRPQAAVPDHHQALASARSVTGAPGRGLLPAPLRADTLTRRHNLTHTRNSRGAP